MPYKTTARILAIDPGTRLLGAAVLEDGDLLYASVKIVKDTKTTPAATVKKVKAIAAALIRDYRPSVLALEKVSPVQAKSSMVLGKAVNQLRVLGRKEGLRVCSLTPRAARIFICQDSKATQMRSAQIIASRHYPWLMKYYEKDAAKPWWEKKYWIHLFDAIALGLSCRSMAAARKPAKKP
jgi:Holliday junction resolvasome RuvABC endonuclease subunit